MEDSTTDGKATLTLTADPELFGGDIAPQILIIDAKTGALISSRFGASDGLEASDTTYETSRVSLADVKAGKF